MLKISQLLALLLVSFLLSACEVYVLPAGDSPQDRISADNNRQRGTYVPEVVGVNYRQGPDYALGLQLLENNYPVRGGGSGRCQLRFEFYGALENYPHYVWSTGRNPQPMGSQRARSTNFGFEVPFDSQGGVQITLNQNEWQKLLQTRMVTVSFWLSNPIYSGSGFYEKRQLGLELPAGNGNLLATRVHLPRVCSAGPEGGHRRGYNPYDDYHRDGKFDYERGREEHRGRRGYQW